MNDQMNQNSSEGANEEINKANIVEETKKVTEKIFEKLDTDKNGTISEEEYSQIVANIVNQLKKISEGLKQ